MGVSGFFCLDIASIRGTACGIAQKRLKNVVVIDLSVRVEDFWKEMRSLIVASNSRLACIEGVKQLITKKHALYFANHSDCPPKMLANAAIEDLGVDIELGVSWLSHDSKYEFVKEMFMQGRFLFARLDLFDITAVTLLSSALKKAGAILDTLYLSNVYEYFDDISDDNEYEAQKSNFPKAVTLLIQSNASVLGVLYSQCDECQDVRLKQRITTFSSQIFQVFAFEKMDCSCFDKSRPQAHPIPDSSKLYAKLFSDAAKLCPALKPKATGLAPPSGAMMTDLKSSG